MIQVGWNLRRLITRVLEEFDCGYVVGIVCSAESGLSRVRVDPYLYFGHSVYDRWFHMLVVKFH